MRRLEGRSALVTGGGSGIGRAAALRLAEEGAAVAVTGRRREPLDVTVAEVERAGGRALALPGDVTDEHDVEAVVAAAAEAFGGLDVLVNNAGEIRRDLLLHEHPTERWDAILGSNLRGAFLVTRAALRRMLERDGDRAIVNVASTLALAAAPRVASYAAAKGGLVAVTKALAVEYGPHGIRCNCVCPGIVETPLAHVDRPDLDERRAEYVAAYPLGRLGEPQDVAAAVAYLASADAAWVTGVVLEVDGGLTAR